MNLELPVYPRVRKIRLTDKANLDEGYIQLGPASSAVCFTNEFILDENNSLQVCTINENLIYMGEDEEGKFFHIVGNNLIEETVRSLSKSNDRRIEYLPTGVSGTTEDRDNADYIYLIDEAIEMRGSGYEGLRRKIRRFVNENNCKLRDGKSDDTDVVWEIAKNWVEKYRVDHSLAEVQSAEIELAALEKALVFAEQLGLEICTFVAESGMIGYAVVEILGSTLMIHFFKTRHNFPGGAEFMFVELAKKYQGRVHTINFQQDLGIAGLRRFKLSLRPSEVRMVYRL
jgi:hypothetical protein